MVTTLEEPIVQLSETIAAERPKPLPSWKQEIAIIMGQCSDSGHVTASMSLANRSEHSYENRNTSEVQAMYQTVVMGIQRRDYWQTDYAVIMGYRFG